MLQPEELLWAVKWVCRKSWMGHGCWSWSSYKNIYIYTLTHPSPITTHNRFHQKGNSKSDKYWSLQVLSCLRLLVLVFSFQSLHQPQSFIILILLTRQETARTHADVLVPVPVAGDAAVGTAGAGWARCLRPVVEDTVGADGTEEAVAGNDCCSASLTCVTSDRHGWFVYKKIRVHKKRETSTETLKHWNNCFFFVL